MADYRNVWVLILAVGLLQISGGMLGVITPIGLQAMETSPFLIGAIAALHSAGFMVGALSASRIIARVGNIRIFSAGAAIAASSSLAMGLLPESWGWALIRPVQGLAFAWMFASAEAWMSAAVPEKARGGVLGFYHVIAKVALLAGPFLIVGYAPLDSRGFIWTAFFFCLALIPVCMTRREEPRRHGSDSLGMRDLFALAPAAVAAVFLAGVINTGTLALLPLYAERIGLSEDATAAAALAMAAAWTGGIISQWPAGRLSDRVDRRVVVAAMAGASILAAIALSIGTSAMPSWMLLVLLGGWGAGSLSFYGIAVAHGVDRAKPEQISGLMAGLLFVWAGGSVIGPPLFGLALETPFGPGGLFALTALLTFALLAAMIWRKQQRPGVAEEDRLNWELTQPTSVTGVEIDPRVDLSETQRPDAAG